MKEDNLKDLHDYQKWVTANSGGNFSLFDYVHGVFSSNKLSSDLASALLSLCWPDFIVHKNLIFVKEEFSELKYSELLEICASEYEIEYWMNLLNIDSLINCESVDEAIRFAKMLAMLWEKKLELDFPTSKVKVIYFIDESDSGEEVYITFQQQKS